MQLTLGSVPEEHRGKMILGLDLSLTAAGAVVLRGDGEVERADTIGYGLTRGASVNEQAKRWLTIANAILGICTEFKVSAAVVENYAFGSKFGREKMGEIGGVVISQLALHSLGLLPIEKMAPTHARKVVFGEGSADKKGIEKYLKGMTKLTDHNQRDAWVVAEALRRKLWVCVGST